MEIDIYIDRKRDIGRERDKGRESERDIERNAITGRLEQSER